LISSEQAIFDRLAGRIELLTPASCASGVAEVQLEPTRQHETL
jgi:hypothetical protein